MGLDDTTSLRMMETVSDCVAYILSFVEETTDYSRHFSKNTLLVACSRCVGRFLAEVPEGHSEAVIKCLKPLCMSGEVSEGAGFLVPGLLQLVSKLQNRLVRNIGFQQSKGKKSYIGFDQVLILCQSLRIHSLGPWLEERFWMYLLH